MEVRIGFLLCLTMVAFAVPARGGEAVPPRRIFDETPAQKAGRLAWWRHDRFGMFIHFGLYSIAARHEWVQSKELIPPDEYAARYFDKFDPDLIDVRAWVKTAKRAGMKYVVLTAKHHEGFCLWDTKTTDFKATKTPCGRDLVREYVDACRAEGIRVGLYFSIIDWHHPDYTVDVNHPLRPRTFGSATQHEFDYADAFAKLNEGRDMKRYRDYMYAQVRELLTDYGRIDILWFDYTIAHEKWGKTWKDWEAVELLKMVRSLQPQVIVDSRLGLMETDDGWDFVTPEQFKPETPPTVRGQEVPWETCQTFSGSWGYFRDEATWKSVPQLVELLSEVVSKGGNLILNVGPTARGRFDRRAEERLKGLADWMECNSRAIYGCGPAPDGFAAPNGTALTYDAAAKRLYLHLYDYPMGFLPLAFWETVSFARFLHDGSEVRLVPPPKRHSQSGEQKSHGGLELPVVKPDCVVPVVELWIR